MRGKRIKEINMKILKQNLIIGRKEIRVLSDRGEDLHDKEWVQGHAYEYYQNLYHDTEGGSKESDAESEKVVIVPPTEEWEIERALKEMKNNKAQVKII
jgi:hypothetical protein